MKTYFSMSTTYFVIMHFTNFCIFIICFTFRESFDLFSWFIASIKLQAIIVSFVAPYMFMFNVTGCAEATGNAYP